MLSLAGINKTDPLFKIFEEGISALPFTIIKILAVWRGIVAYVGLPGGT